MITRLVVCASGEGTNFESMVEATHQGALRAEVVGLITNRRLAGAIARAERLGISHHVLSPPKFATRAEWDAAMVGQLAAWQTDWVALAGFLVRIGPQVLHKYSGRIVNSHPALLPKYGGEGMYGDHVHRAVIAAGETETGVTIHLIDEHYDRGKILAQARLTVRQGESAVQLAQRVKALERTLYPKVLNDLLITSSTTG